MIDNYNSHSVRISQYESAVTKGQTVNKAARYYLGGLNVLPLKLDGSKSPWIKWAERHEQRPSLDATLLPFWDRLSGLGVVCGKTSGNLEIMDFDRADLFDDWRSRLTADAQDELTLLPHVLTPRPGCQVYWRCGVIEGNQALAGPEDPQLPCWIETRGQGGYAVLPGSPLTVHKNCTPYRLLNGDLLAVPTISPELRGDYLATARSFNERPAPTETIWAVPSLAGLAALRGYQAPQNRPGDIYCREATWEEVLEPHGWELSHTDKNQVSYWRRPDKSEGHSATTNHGGTDKFCCFSSSVSGFAKDMFYDKFAVYAVLTCKGDYAQAARQLAREGYGESEPAPDAELDKWFS